MLEFAQRGDEAVEGHCVDVVSEEIVAAHVAAVCILGDEASSYRVPVLSRCAVVSPEEEDGAGIFDILVKQGLPCAHYIDIWQEWFDDVGVEIGHSFGMSVLKWRHCDRADRIELLNQALGADATLIRI